MQDRKLLTDEQIKVCAELDSMNQLHLVDPEVKEQYLGTLRTFELIKAGIQIKISGCHSHEDA